MIDIGKTYEARKKELTEKIRNGRILPEIYSFSGYCYFCKNQKEKIMLEINDEIKIKNNPVKTQQLIDIDCYERLLKPQPFSFLA